LIGHLHLNLSQFFNIPEPLNFMGGQVLERGAGKETGKAELLGRSRVTATD